VVGGWERSVRTPPPVSGGIGPGGQGEAGREEAEGRSDRRTGEVHRGSGSVTSVAQTVVFAHDRGG
jgi:hypothetical protein